MTGSQSRMTSNHSQLTSKHCRMASNHSRRTGKHDRRIGLLKPGKPLHVPEHWLYGDRLVIVLHPLLVMPNCVLAKPLCFFVHDSLLISTSILLRSILPPLLRRGWGRLSSLLGFLQPSANFDKLSYQQADNRKKYRFHEKAIKSKLRLWSFNYE